MALQLPGCDSLDAMMNVLDPSWSGMVERCLSGRLLRSFAVTDTHDCIILENIMEECCPDDLQRCMYYGFKDGLDTCWSSPANLTTYSRLADRLMAYRDSQLHHQK